MVLEVDPSKRRISLGLKQASQSVGSLSPTSTRSAPTVEGEVKNITEFGLFVGLDGDVDGMVHLSDSTGASPGEEAIASDYKQGRHGQGASAQGARRRRREGAHLARHQAAARTARPASSSAAILAATATSSARPLPGRPEVRCHGHRLRSLARSPTSRSRRCSSPKKTARPTARRGDILGSASGLVYDRDPARPGAGFSLADFYNTIHGHALGGESAIPLKEVFGNCRT
jgi:hypothetical protein